MTTGSFGSATERYCAKHDKKRRFFFCFYCSIIRIVECQLVWGSFASSPFVVDSLTSLQSRTELSGDCLQETPLNDIHSLECHRVEVPTTFEHLTRGHRPAQPLTTADLRVGHLTQHVHDRRHRRNTMSSVQLRLPSRILHLNACRRFLIHPEWAAGGARVSTRLLDPRLNLASLFPFRPVLE